VFATKYGLSVSLVMTLFVSATGWLIVVDLGLIPGAQKVMQFRGSFADYKALAVRRALKRINSKKGGKGVAKS
jgi:hypothetical protein